MSTTGRGALAQSPTADREIVTSRVIDAPRELVSEAFTDIRHLSRWWGPGGFTTTTRSFQFGVGGDCHPTTRPTFHTGGSGPYRRDRTLSAGCPHPAESVRCRALMRAVDLAEVAVPPRGLRDSPPTQHEA